MCFLDGTGRVNQRRRCGRRVEPRGRGARACVWSRAAAADEQGAQTAHSSLIVLSKCCWVGGVVCVTSDIVFARCLLFVTWQYCGEHELHQLSPRFLMHDPHAPQFNGYETGATLKLMMGHKNDNAVLHVLV